MAGRITPKLLMVTNNHPIDWGSDPEFMFLLIHALLLALEEQGWLDTVEIRHAQEKLRLQKQDWCKKHRKDI